MKSACLRLALLPVFSLSLYTLQAQNNPVQIVGPNVLTCNQPCITLQVQLSPPFSPASAVYTWTGSGVPFPAGIQNLQVCQPGLYTVVVTDINSGQTATAATVVTANMTFPIVTIESSNPNIICTNATNSGNTFERVCPGSTLSYFATVTGSSNDFLIDWSVAGAEKYTLDADPRFIVITWKTQGMASITVTATDPFSGCSMTTTMWIDIVPEPEALIQTTPAAPAGSDTLEVCQGEAVWFSSAPSRFTESVEWLFGDDKSKPVFTEGEHYFQKPGLYPVALIARSNCFCADTTQVWVRVRDAVAPQLVCSGTVCQGATVTYRVQPACPDMVWTVQNGAILGNSGDSVTVQWAGGPAGMLYLSGIDCAGNQCPGPVAYRIPVIDDAAKIQGPKTVCPGSISTYRIEAFGGTGYVWTLTGSGKITSGQGTAQIEVEWNDANITNPSYIQVEYDNCTLGCKGKDAIAVFIQPPFAINGPLERCAGSSGSFSARKTTNNQVVSCNWTLFDPQGDPVWVSPAAASAPSISFGQQPGVYRIVAEPVDPAQVCTARAEWRVRVAPPPPAPTGIGGDTLICPGEPLTYKALAPSPGAVVRWAVQNGPGPVVADNGPAINLKWDAQAPRRLAAWQVSADGLGCVSDTVYLGVQALGQVSLQGPPAVCKGDVVQYSSGIQGKWTYEWVIEPAEAGVIAGGQGTPTVEVFWQTPGEHQVRLGICGTFGSLPVSVKPTPEPAVTHPEGLCPGAVAQVQTTAPFAAYTWTTAAGALVGSAATLDAGPGRFALTVTDVYGCTGITAFDIQKYPLPNISISTPDPTGFCNNSRLVSMNALVNGDGDYSFEWFKDGVGLSVFTPTYTTNQYGLYSARVTNSFGCTASDGDILIFEYCKGGPCHNPDPPPVCPAGAIGLKIVPTAACDSFGFQLVPGLDYAPGTASWRFGKSGGPSLGQVPGDSVAFRFSNAGHYLAILFAQLQNGAICAVVDSVRVEAVAQFSVDPACPGDTTAFKDGSTYLPNSGISAWKWSFGDPSGGAANHSTVREPGYLYPNGGSYPVQLTVTANSGCTSTAAGPVAIPAIPLAQAITLSPGCVNMAVPVSVVPQPDILTYAWEFGDPASGSANTTDGAEVYHQFSTPGDYILRLTSTTVFGCTNSQTAQMALAPNTLNGPIAPANPPVLCPGASLALTAPPGGIAYAWADSSAGANRTVSATGAYAVTLTDANGCTYAPAPAFVKVAESPAALVKALLTNNLGQVTETVYGNLSICAGEGVRLVASGVGIYTYKWSSGQMGSSVFYSKEHGNTLPVGKHTFVVTVTDPATGCTAVTAPFVVQVNAVPAPFSITASQLCASGDPVTLNMTTPGQPGYRYAWNTGDTTAAITTTFAGRYFLYVYNAAGCTAQSNEVTLRPGPKVAAIPSGCYTRCRPDTLCLPFIPSIAAWQWYKDGAPIAGATTPGFVATQSGTYWAKLTDKFGCSANSDPLTLQLYDGYGHILGKVWADANHNGAIDAGDTLVTGIPVQLEQLAGLVGQTQSNGIGNFAFANVLSTEYVVRINPADLPASWEIVIGQAPVALFGCDTQAEVALLLKEVCLNTVTSTVQLNACPGGSVVYNGVSIPEGGSQVFQLTSASGCDSLLTVNVAALPISAGVLNVSVCPGTVYDYNGTPVAAGASQDFVLQNFLGCDSVLTVNVAALPVSTGVLNVSVCPGAAYDYNGMAVPAGASQDFVLQNYLGCDSVLTVNVAALPVSAGTLNVSVCPGTVYDYNGTTIAAGASKDFMLQNSLGCDSVLTVNVAALPVSAGVLNVSVCPGAAYDYNGMAVAAGTSKNFVLQNSLGCDSVLTVNVAALPVSAGVLNVSVCPGAAYNYDGTAVLAGTSKDFVLQNSLGCDSLLTVNVSALPVSAGVLNVSVCPGTVYDYYGTAVAVGASQDFMLQNSLGCDSLLTVNVSALPVSAGVLNVSVCPGTVYDYYGTAVAAGASQDFVLQNYLGCDSVLSVNVSALPVSTGVLNVSVCPGTAYDYNGTAVAAGASQDFVLQNYLGCDSVLTVNVAALPVSAGVLNVSVCPGAAYNYDGTAVLAGTSKDFVLQNSLGCDSVLTVNVSALPVSVGAVHAVACPGESFVYQGASLQAGQSRVFTLQNAAGCDSLVTVTVSGLSVSSETLNVAVCPDETYLYSGVALRPGETRVFHFNNQEGCDSTVTVVVSAYPAASFDLATTPSCSATGSGSLTVKNPGGGLPPYRYSLDGTFFQDEPVFDHLKPGSYTVWLEDSHACLFPQAVELPALLPLSLGLDDAPLPCDGGGVRLEPLLKGDLGGLGIRWSTGATALAITVHEPGPVWVEAHNACDTLRRDIRVDWAGEGKDFSYAYLPNVFAPASNDPDNSNFRPHFAPELDIANYRFEIYDRWGNLLFRSHDPAEGWTGPFRQQDMKPAVYVWQLWADIGYCGGVRAVRKVGDVTIVR